MKAIVSAMGPDVTAPIDQRFGRASHLVVVDTETGEWQAHPNPGATLDQGAGIEAARYAAEHGADAVITGMTGPNAFKTLAAAGIAVYSIAGGCVSEAIERFRTGSLDEVTEPSVDAHAGLRGNP